MKASYLLATLLASHRPQLEQPGPPQIHLAVFCTFPFQASMHLKANNSLSFIYPERLNASNAFDAYLRLPFLGISISTHTESYFRRRKFARNAWLCLPFL